jgi:hypothetical protein
MPGYAKPILINRLTKLVAMLYAETPQLQLSFPHTRLQSAPDQKMADMYVPQGTLWNAVVRVVQATGCSQDQAIAALKVREKSLDSNLFGRILVDLAPY